MGKTKLFYNILNVLCIIFSCLCVLGAIFVICINGYLFETFGQMLRDMMGDGGFTTILIAALIPVLFILWFFINMFIFIFYALPIISLICLIASSCYAIKHKTTKDIQIFSIVAFVIMTLYIGLRVDGIHYTKYMGFNITFFVAIVVLLMLCYIKAIYEVINNIKTKNKERRE